MLNSVWFYVHVHVKPAPDFRGSGSPRAKVTSSWETLDVGAGTPQRLSTAKPAFWFLAFITISRSKV